MTAVQLLVSSHCSQSFDMSWFPLRRTWNPLPRFTRYLCGERRKSARWTISKSRLLVQYWCHT